MGRQRLTAVNRLKVWARELRKQSIALYIAARHPRTPWYAKLLAIGIAAYALSPIDLIPDFIPVVGLLDEVLLLPLSIAGVMKLIPADVMVESRAEAARRIAAPVSWAAACLIATIWIAAVGWAGWLAYRWTVG